MLNKFLLLFLLTLNLNVTSQETEYIKYSTSNYSIEYPSNWLIDDSGEQGVTFVIRPKNPDTNKEFMENINLAIQNLNNNEISLDEYKGITENQISGMLVDYNLILSEIKSKDGYNYHELIVEGSVNETKLKGIVYTWLQNKKAYALTFITSFEDYKYNHLIAKSILNSFRFSKN